MYSSLSTTGQNDTKNKFIWQKNSSDLKVSIVTGCIICKLVLLVLALFLICFASGIKYPWNVSFWDFLDF